MSTNRIIVIGGVSVGLWWLFFTCKGREVLNRIMRALGRPEVKPCCSGCSDHVSSPAPASAELGAMPAPSSPIVLPAPPVQGLSSAFVPPSFTATEPTVPSIGLPGLQSGNYAAGESITYPAPPPPLGEPYTERVSALSSCVEPECRTYSEPAPVLVQEFKASREPAPVVDGAALPPSTSTGTYDGISGTVGTLSAVLGVLRDAAPSFLKPAPELALVRTEHTTFYDPAPAYTSVPKLTTEVRR